MSQNRPMWELLRKLNDIRTARSSQMRLNLNMSSYNFKIGS
ncbi:hypothetical protein LEP1GSC170_3542 [Leptospira interrogans serovar Bataviae str. HAI135]|nr:hypothetical protein LEP1GSC170_3542 [Leptospira interrogans serovar Bataviae str. HAI135]